MEPRREHRLFDPETGRRLNQVTGKPVPRDRLWDLIPTRDITVRLEVNELHEAPYSYERRDGEGTVAIPTRYVSLQGSTTSSVAFPPVVLDEEQATRLRDRLNDFLEGRTPNPWDDLSE